MTTRESSAPKSASPARGKGTSSIDLDVYDRQQGMGTETVTTTTTTTIKANPEPLAHLSAGFLSSLQEFDGIVANYPGNVNQCYQRLDQAFAAKNPELDVQSILSSETIIRIGAIYDPSNAAQDQRVEGNSKGNARVKAKSKTNMRLPWGLPKEVLRMIFGNTAVQSRRFITALNQMAHNVELQPALKSLLHRQQIRRSGTESERGVSRKDLWMAVDAERALRDYQGWISSRRDKGRNVQAGKKRKRTEADDHVTATTHQDSDRGFLSQPEHIRSAVEGSICVDANSHAEGDRRDEKKRRIVHDPPPSGNRCGLMNSPLSTIVEEDMELHQQSPRRDEPRIHRQNRGPERPQDYQHSPQPDNDYEQNVLDDSKVDDMQGNIIGEISDDAVYDFGDPGDYSDHHSISIDLSIDGDDSPGDSDFDKPFSPERARNDNNRHLADMHSSPSVICLDLSPSPTRSDNANKRPRNSDGGIVLEIDPSLDANPRPRNRSTPPRVAGAPNQVAPVAPRSLDPSITQRCPAPSDNSSQQEQCSPAGLPMSLVPESSRTPSARSSNQQDNLVTKLRTSVPTNTVSSRMPPHPSKSTHASAGEAQSIAMPERSPRVSHVPPTYTPSTEQSHLAQSLAPGRLVSSFAIDDLLSVLNPDMSRYSIVSSTYVDTVRPERNDTKSCRISQSTELIIVPMHHPTLIPNHFTVAIAHRTTNVVEYYDSTPSPPIHFFERTKACLDRFLTAVDPNGEREFQQFTTHPQSGVMDCGIHVLVFAIVRMLGLPLPAAIEPDVWRRYFAAVLDDVSPPSLHAQAIAADVRTSTEERTASSLSAATLQQVAALETKRKAIFCLRRTFDVAACIRTVLRKLIACDARVAERSKDLDRRAARLEQGRALIFDEMGEDYCRAVRQKQQSILAELGSLHNSNELRAGRAPSLLRVLGLLAKDMDFVKKQEDLMCEQYNEAIAPLPDLLRAVQGMVDGVASPDMRMQPRELNETDEGNMEE